jgi:Sulfotransferase domain
MRRSCRNAPVGAAAAAAAALLSGCVCRLPHDAAAALSWAVAAESATATDDDSSSSSQIREEPSGVSIGGRSTGTDAEGVDASPHPSTGTVHPTRKIHVIGAGLSRTGTVSTVQALDRLGFHAFHMKDMFAIPGHFELWYQYYFPEAATTKTTTLNDVMDRIEQDGFNATMDEPTNLHFVELLERYPEAKVILNLRMGGGRAWAEGFLASVYPIPYLMDRPPFSWSSTVSKQSQLLHRTYRELGVSYDPQHQLTHEEQRDRMAETYERWVEHVRAKVPPSQLLEFHVQDGWVPLCSFLAPTDARVDEACHEILQSHEAYPHANDGNFVRRIVQVMRVICALVEALPVMVALIAAVWGVMAYVKRVKRDSASKRKVE